MEAFAEGKDAKDGDQEKLDALKVPVPIREHERLAILRQCNLLDTPNDESFDRYVSLAHRFFKVPIVLISLMDVDRQWFKSRIGLAAAQTSRDVAFCAYTLLDETPRVMVVPDAYLDPRFCNNPLVRGPPYIRFYAGASIIVKGLKIATLCLIDNVPHGPLSHNDEEILLGIADTISDIMTMRRQQTLEERFNGVFMHQKYCQGFPTRCQVCFYSHELAREALAFQRQVLNLGHFLDDAMRVMARVILDSDPHADGKKENHSMVGGGGKAEGFLPCNVRAVLQSIQAALKESDQAKCPCELVLTLHQSSENVESHADMLLMCFTALLYAFSGTVKSALWTKVKLVVQEEALVIEMYVPRTKQSDGGEAMKLFQESVMPVKKMLGWVGGSLFVSDNIVEEECMGMGLRVPRFHHRRHVSAASTLVVSLSGVSSPTASAKRGISPAVATTKSSSGSLLYASKDLASELWTALTTTVAVPSNHHRKVTPEPSQSTISL